MFHKILVIQTASIGDVVLVTPVLERLREKFPEAGIDLLLKKGNEGLFGGHPFLRRLWTWNKSSGKYCELLQLVQAIRKQRYDLVINAHRFFSSGLISAFSGSRERTGFDKNPLSFLYTRRVRHVIGRDGRHEAERNLELIPGENPEPGQARIRLYPSEADSEAVRAFQDHPYCCISPASLWFTKQYPEDRWVDLIRAVTGRYQVFLLGSGKEAGLAGRIVAAAGTDRVNSLAGRLTLLQSAALMAGAAMNFVNDSAPLHLCSAMDAPVTAVFCSTLPSFGFGPYGSRGTVVETPEDLPCRPCGLHGKVACPEKHFRCALSIQTGQFLNRLDL